MNQVNFDSLNNIKAPEQWIKNAAAIPETSVKKRAFPLYRVAAAASIVLVSVIGLLIYLSFGNHTPIELRNNAAGVVPSTETAGDRSFPDDGELPNLDAMLPTWPRVYPTDAAGEPVIESPTEPKAAREKPSVTTPTEKGRSGTKTVSPTEIAEEPTQGAPSPTTTPDSIVAPDPTDHSSDFPVTPTTPPAMQEPTEILPNEMPYISAVATFPASMLRDDDVVCCAIYDHGKLLSQGEASIYIMKSGNVFASYETDIEAEQGKTYHYSFFRNSASTSGWGAATILASGTLTY